MTRSVSNLGYWCGLAAFTSTLAFVFVQILQVAGVLRFPADEILIYATSLCIVLPFILGMLALHHLTPADKQFWTHASLIFTIIYAVFVTANYVVQLSTVIPAKLNGLSGAIRILEQLPIPCSGTLTHWATSLWAWHVCLRFLRSSASDLSGGSGDHSSPTRSSHRSLGSSTSLRRFRPGYCFSAFHGLSRHRFS